MFADLATKLLEGEGAAPASSSVNSQAATSQPVPEDHTSPGLAASATGMATRSTPSSGALPRTALAPALAVLQEAGVGAAQTQMPLGNPANPATPDASPIPRVSNMDAARPTPVAGNTATAFAVPVARPATSVPTAQEQSMAALYTSRGDEMLAIKDISAARKFYEYAANAGSARAATALARTHDPAFLTRLGAVGLRPDPVLAAAWYRKAAALGDPDADARLHTLSTEAAK
jgi:TPR repeat protein